MAGRKAKVTVKMFGTGNFVIGDTLYAFRDGEEIEVQNEEHKELLEKEAARREAVYNKTQALTAQTKAKRD